MEKTNSTKICGYTPAKIRGIGYDDGSNLEETDQCLCTKCEAGFYACKIKYHVIIHDSMETLNNDMDDYVSMGIGEAKLVEVSKTNLKSISTEDNPCIEEEDT